MARRFLGNVIVLEVLGPVAEAGPSIRDAVLSALADNPEAVVCDLSGLGGLPGPESLEMLASVGAEVRAWPGVPVAMVSPDAGVRRRLAQHPDGEHLVVAGSLLPALSLLSGHQPAEVVSLSLDPVAQSARAARERVAGACREWGLEHHRDAATLVASELVTNVIQHAATDLELAIARHGPRLRVAVRDSTAHPPHVLSTDASATAGRGMLLVAAIARAWGVLPTEEDGKVVWAVLDGPPDPAAPAD